MIAQLDKEFIKRSKRNTIVRLQSYLFFEGRPLTTKGQWINPLVFALFRLWKVMPQLKKVKNPTFVIGTGRSGTTVLGVILAMHKNVGFLNEPKALWHAAFSGEDIIGSYSMGHATYRLTEEQADKKVIKKMHRMFGSYLFWTRRKVVVDKYPELIFRVPFVKKIFPDAKFIFLVRNGWDTIQSIDHWSERLGVEEEGETHDWWGRNDRKWQILVSDLARNHPFFSHHLDELESMDNHTHRAAVEWVLTMEEGLELVTKYPDQIMLLNYEQLVNNPANVLGDLMNHIGLPSDKQFIEYSKHKLKSVNPRPKVPLPEFLNTVFEETMRNLGYKD